MPYLIDMTTFWSNAGVVSGDTNADNQYNTFANGLLMADGSTIYNMKQFFDYNNHSRYSFWNQWNAISSGDIYGEFKAYEFTNDPAIYDFYTFWKYAPQYIGASPPAPPAWRIFGAPGDNVYTPPVSLDSGNTWNSTIVSSVGLPTASVFQTPIVDSYTYGNQAAYFGSIHFNGQSFIYKFDFLTQAYTLAYTFNSNTSRSQNAMVWINDNLFLSFTISPVNNRHRSTNGLVSFTTGTISPSIAPQKVAYSPSLDKLVLYGITGNLSKMFVFSNNSGSTFTLCNTHTAFPSNLTCNDLEWFEDMGLFVALFSNSGTFSLIMTSSDGENWNIAYNTTQPTAKENWVSCAFNPITQTFMVIGDNCDFGLVSLDLCNSFTPIAPQKDNWSRLLWVPDSNRFIAFSRNAGSDTPYYTEDDGASWTQLTSPDIKGWKNVIVYQ
jgi:hypothetical protein